MGINSLGLIRSFFNHLDQLSPNHLKSEPIKQESPRKENQIPPKFKSTFKTVKFRPLNSSNKNLISPIPSCAFWMWDKIDVSNWLATNGFAKYCKFFFKGEINGFTLSAINESELEEIGIESLADRKELFEKIVELRGNIKPTLICKTKELINLKN